MKEFLGHKIETYQKECVRKGYGGDLDFYTVDARRCVCGVPIGSNESDYLGSDTRALQERVRWLEHLFEVAFSDNFDQEQLRCDFDCGYCREPDDEWN